jgi:hypothetical protein
VVELDLIGDALLGLCSVRGETRPSHDRGRSGRSA